MKIHEYQAREILTKFNVPIPRGIVAQTAQQAAEAAETLGGNVWAVKSQVHAGGRGKAGGVKIAKSIEEVRSYAEDMIGSRLVTIQTGAEGAAVDRVLVQEGLSIVGEYYVGFLVDRVTQKPVLLVSAAGGMAIEEVAAKTPEKIIQVQIDIEKGLGKEEAAAAARRLGIEEALQEDAADILVALWHAFVGMDCTLLEINPLVVTADKKVLPLDVKMVFDDSALFRHPELEELHDPNQEDPIELQAHHAGLQYIKLDGNIACLVNGAGLAMATMDSIKLFGGEPANFLDIGGGATPEKVTAAFQFMLSQDGVKIILVNIFGGIMKCDVIAEGIVQACHNVKLDVPLIVRMRGTNEERGREILAESQLPITPVVSLEEAARTAVNMAGGNE